MRSRKHFFSSCLAVRLARWFAVLTLTLSVPSRLPGADETWSTWQVAYGSATGGGIDISFRRGDYIKDYSGYQYNYRVRNRYNRAVSFAVVEDRTDRDGRTLRGGGGYVLKPGEMNQGGSVSSKPPVCRVTSFCYADGTPNGSNPAASDPSATRDKQSDEIQASEAAGRAEEQHQRELQQEKLRASQQDYQNRKQAREQRSNAEYQRKSTVLRELSDSLTDSLQQFADEKVRQSEDKLRKIEDEIEKDEENARQEANRTAAAQRTAGPTIATVPRVNSGNSIPYSPPPPAKASPLFDEPLSSFIRADAPASENIRRAGDAVSKSADNTSGNSLLSQLLSDMKTESAKPSRATVTPPKPGHPGNPTADLMESLLDQPRPAKH